MDLLVVGSVNMDLVIKVSSLPRRGETVSGDSFQTIPGGKGANQATAAARLGASVGLVGRVGADHFGATLREQLLKNRVDISGGLLVFFGVFGIHSPGDD